MPDPIGRSAILHVVLLLLTAFFTFARAGVEHAAGKLRKSPEPREGAPAGRLLDILSRPDRFLIAMDTCAGLAALWLTAAACTTYAALPASLLEKAGMVPRAANAVAVFLSLVVAAVVVMSLAVLLPRKIAVLRPQGVLRVVFWPAWAVSRLVSPLCALIDFISGTLVRLLRIRPLLDSGEVSEDEIRMMVDIGEVAGAIESTEKEMIENVFEFNNMSAEDIMVHRTDMVLVWEDDSEDAILKTIRESGLSRFPVCREDVDDIIGVLSTRDYLLNYRLESPKPLKELLRNALFVPESVRTDVLFRQMQRQKVHMAIVVDEYGGTSGLLTMEDLLEQLVGEIYDEFDNEEELEIIKLDDNLWRVSGGAELEMLAEAVGLDIPENEEYDTLGGLVFSHLTVIPDDGSHPEVEALGMKIVVEELLDRRVEWARVSKIIEQADSEEPTEE